MATTKRKTKETKSDPKKPKKGYSKSGKKLGRPRTAKPIKRRPSAGRPTKLTTVFLKAAEEVLATKKGAFDEERGEFVPAPINPVIIFTDSELVDEINDVLLQQGNEEAQIDNRTFVRWKSNVLNDTPNKTDENDVFTKFCLVVKRALRREKSNLLAELRSGSAGEWQKYAWIIERKFEEWNLKRITDATVQTTTEYIIGDGDPDEINN